MSSHILCVAPAELAVSTRSSVRLDTGESQNWLTYLQFGVSKSGTGELDRLQVPPRTWARVGWLDGRSTGPSGRLDRVHDRIHGNGAQGQRCEQEIRIGRNGCSSFEHGHSPEWPPVLRLRIPENHGRVGMEVPPAVSWAEGTVPKPN